LRLPQEPFTLIFTGHFPGAVYFIVLALILKYGGIKRYVGRPFSFTMVALMFSALVVSHILELLFRGGIAPFYQPLTF
jgi:hypothetical protein